MFAYSSRAALVGAFVVGLAATSFAVCPPAACPHVCKGVMVTMTYPIADLILLVGTGKPCEDDLMRIIASTVCPKSWAEKGGEGSQEYHPLTLSLVVRQTSEVHEQIQALLSAMRRRMDVQVAMEIRFITLSPELVDSLGLKRPAEAGETALSFIDDTQYRVLMEKVQGDVQANVMQAPKMTVLDGQEAKLDVHEDQSFVTDMGIVEVGGRKAILPRVQKLSSGVKIDALPLVSADRRFVKLHMGVELSHIEARVPTYPMFCVLGREDGKVKPIILTQHIQQPRRNVIRIEKSLVIPDGKSAVLTSCEMEREVREEHRVPVLGDIPYLGRVFTSVGYTKRAEHLLVVVTPRILVSPEEEKLVTAARPATYVAEESEPEPKKMPSAPIPTLYTKDKKFQLTYEVDNVGSSAIKQVEVWWTKDGNPWERFCEDVKPTGKVVISVKDDGTYGFRLNPRSGAGLAAPAPQGIDAPHTWVVVDTTAPAVEMEPVKVENTNNGEVVFQWAVTDTHLAANPVKIRYAEKPEGPWKELVAGKAAAGTYRHPVKNLPTVAYFRIDAKDKSGNVGTAWTTEPVQIDLKVPVIRKVIGVPAP